MDCTPKMIQPVKQREHHRDALQFQTKNSLDLDWSTLFTNIFIMNCHFISNMVTLCSWCKIGLIKVGIFQLAFLGKIQLAVTITVCNARHILFKGHAKDVIQIAREGCHMFFMSTIWNQHGVPVTQLVVSLWGFTPENVVTFISDDIYGGYCTGWESETHLRVKWW